MALQGPQGPCALQDPEQRVCGGVVQGLRGLVECLGAKTGSRVVVVDTREELGVYLRGHPYTRRELEMPTASMHHAGIHWRELRKLERWLRDDVCSSSTYGADDGVHRVLVHKEAPVRHPSFPLLFWVVVAALRRRAVPRAPPRSYCLPLRSRGTCLVSAGVGA